MNEKTNTLKLTKPNDLEIVFTREFNASRQLVWDAHTEPELVRRWMLGPEGWSMPVCEIDLRVGGAIRYVWRNADRREMTVRGAFLVIEPPSRLAWTEIFDEPWYPGQGMNDLMLEDQGGRTLMTFTNRYETKEARDMALKSGMDEGMSTAYDHLERMLCA